MLKLPNYTLFDLEKIIKYGNLTDRELKIMELRNCDNPPSIEQIAEMMDMSPSTVSRTIRGLKNKIMRIL